MNSSSSPLLAVRHLVKHFPARAGGGKIARAVDDISFDLSAGETLALVGESGCGKTTTGRLILRLIEPTREKLPATDGSVVVEPMQSRILFAGADVTTMNRVELLAYRRQAQIIFQDPFSSLNPRMTVEQIVREPLVVHGLTRRAQTRGQVVIQTPDRVQELLKLVGLNPEHAHRFPHEFSGGQRQRIGIARALALQPKLIVCDEPVSALDVSVQAQIINLLADLQQQLGVAYLFISHNLAVVRHLAHRVAVMYLGRIVELGTTGQVFSAPRHPYTQALLSAVPVPDPTRARDRLRLEGDAASPVDVPAGCRFHPRCPYAQPVCREVDPRLTGRASGSQAACHLANGHERFV